MRTHSRNFKLHPETATFVGSSSCVDSFAQVYPDRPELGLVLVTPTEELTFTLHSVDHRIGGGVDGWSLRTADGRFSMYLLNDHGSPLEKSFLRKVLALP